MSRWSTPPAWANVARAVDGRGNEELTAAREVGVNRRRRKSSRPFGMTGGPPRTISSRSHSPAGGSGGFSLRAGAPTITATANTQPPIDAPDPREAPRPPNNKVTGRGGAATLPPQSLLAAAVPCTELVRRAAASGRPWKKVTVRTVEIVLRRPAARLHSTNRSTR